MGSPQLIRRLRIAASVFFALIAVGLCVLWVRSYWRADQCFHVGTKYTLLLSNYGHLQFVHTTIPGVKSVTPWTHMSSPASEEPVDYWSRDEKPGKGS
jgi:hypothetical protein